MNWKQPIPTECKQFDLVTRLVFVEIMLFTRNADMDSPEEFWHGNKRHFVQLKKGQCIFSIERFCKQSQISKNRVDKSLKILISQKPLINMQINRKSYGMEITIQNYDELVNMQINQRIKSKSNQNQIEIKHESSIKNVLEIGEIDKTDLSNTPPTPSCQNIAWLEAEEAKVYLTQKFPQVDIQSQLEIARSWLKSEGKQKSDYKAFMENWCRRCIEKGTGLKPVQQKRNAVFIEPIKKPVRTSTVKSFKEIMAERNKIKQQENEEEKEAS